VPDDLGTALLEQAQEYLDSEAEDADLAYRRRG